MDANEAAERDEFLRALDELASLLRSWGEERWADWLERDRRLIAEEHPDALGHLLTAFGGARSLRDLTIDPDNGHDIDPDRVRPVNDRLRTLRSAVVQKATALQGDVSPSP